MVQQLQEITHMLKDRVQQHLGLVLMLKETIQGLMGIIRIQPDPVMLQKGKIAHYKDIIYLTMEYTQKIPLYGYKVQVRPTSI